MDSSCSFSCHFPLPTLTCSTSSPYFIDFSQQRQPLFNRHALPKPEISTTYPILLFVLIPTRHPILLLVLIPTRRNPAKTAKHIEAGLGSGSSTFSVMKYMMDEYYGVQHVM